MDKEGYRKALREYDEMERRRVIAELEKEEEDYTDEDEV